MSDILDPAELIDYSPGAVVSRTLIKGKAGSATLFSFDKGEGLDEHSAPFDALIHVLDGEAAITLGGKRHLLKAGRMLLMPAGAPHAVKAVARFKMLLFLVRNSPLTK